MTLASVPLVSLSPVGLPSVKGASLRRADAAHGAAGGDALGRLQVPRTAAARVAARATEHVSGGGPVGCGRSICGLRDGRVSV